MVTNFHPKDNLPGVGYRCPCDGVVREEERWYILHQSH